MMLPRISIVIPTFDRPQKLRRSLKSCLDQTTPPFEIIVVDNGQNPKTRSVVEDASQNASGINVQYYPSELFKVRRALANGIEAAQGDWVILLDDDDFLVTNRIHHDLQILQEVEPEVILLVQNFIRVDYKNEIIWEHKMEDKTLGLFEALVIDSFPPPPAGTWRASTLKTRHSFDQPNGWTDFDLYASVLPYGQVQASGNIGYVMDDTRVPGRLTTDHRQTIEVIETHRERFLDNRKFLDVPSEIIDQRLDQQLAFYCGKNLGFSALFDENRKNARRHFKEFFKGIISPLRAVVSRVFANQMPEIRGSKTYSLKAYSKQHQDLSDYVKALKIN